MKIIYKQRAICAFTAFFVFLAGCSFAGFFDHGKKAPEAAEKYKKIAVLPFDNISGRKDAGKLVAETYAAELFKDGRYYVEEPGNIRQFIVQEQIESIGEVELERLKLLGKRLKVDGVVVGVVEEFDDGRGGPPLVSITARLVESATGRVAWSAQTRRRGDDYIIAFDFGNVRSVNTLMSMAVREMIETIDW